MRIHIHKDRWWLLLAPNFLFALDIVLTIIGQAGGLWNESVTTPNEANPLGAFLLAIHPLVFIAGAVGYAVAFSLAILVFPRWLALYCFLTLTLAHSYGSSSWVALGLYQKGLPGVDQSFVYAVVGTLSLVMYLRIKEQS
ncbi:MAG: hypothetical protein ACYS6K_00665 [Planctomycetota bacterium]|jgi:hypothetical protein